MNIFSLDKTDHFPTWVPENIATPSIPNKNLQHWLSDTGSLTRKLSQAYHTELRVNVLQQDWGEPDITELQRLGMTIDEQRYIVRRVQLVLDGIPRVYARSIFPESCLNLKGRHIHQLGETPLGKWLFTHPELIRSTFEVTQIHPCLLPEDAGVCHKNTLWGRRSVFSLNHKNPMLVTEYFLTELPDANAHHAVVALSNK